MITINPAGGGVSLSSTPAKQSNANSEISLFLNLLKGLSSDLQSLAANADSIASIANATVSTSSGLSGPLFSGPSLTASGNLTETTMANGQPMTNEDAFSYTQFQAGQAYGVGAVFGYSPLPSDVSGTQQISPPESALTVSPAIDIADVAEKDFSFISASFNGFSIDGQMNVRRENSIC